MAGSIESEEGLREALAGLARDKKIVFVGAVQDGDETLYQGLVEAERAIKTDDKLRYQEALKRLESVESGCRERLEPEYRAKLEGCLAFLRANIGRLYVELMLHDGGVTRWLKELERLHSGAM